MLKSLDELPPELLSQIVFHLETTRTLLYLSLTCKRLHDYVERDGFRVFVQSNFPSIQTPPFWKPAAHALITISRSWDRKAFIARCIAPHIADINGNGLVKHGKRFCMQPRRRAQTMGYQPVIDSYIDWYGLDWCSRREILAWGAGPDLVLRVKSMGHRAEASYQASIAGGKRMKHFDQHHHMNEWMVHREPGMVEGRDDITSVNLLRPSQKAASESEYTVIGRASGRLDIVKVSTTDSESFKVAGLISGKPIRSASINSTSDPLVAACMADSTISLYSLNLAQNLLKSVGEISEQFERRTWSTQFLRHDRLAVGRGPSETPIHLYSLGQDGVSTGSVRKFGVRALSADNGIDTVDDAVNNGAPTIYSIAPVAPSALAGGADGDVFLTGSFDGTVRYVLAGVEVG